VTALLYQQELVSSLSANVVHARHSTDVACSDFSSSYRQIHQK